MEKNELMETYECDCGADRLPSTAQLYRIAGKGEYKSCMNVCVCMGVRVCVSEREREKVCVCVGAGARV